ncbi:MAG: histidine phosphatase family protein [Chloroflexia bacterium]|nr:histidine phosphatase family protein [Chloroflexia bacterium]
MGVQLILIRHGRTAWNQEVRFRGRQDLPLDAFGRAQAQAAARHIAARWPELAAVYASPLQRARQTAAPVAQALHLDLQIQRGLLDVDYGDWTGRTPAEMEAEDPQRFQRWQSTPQQVRFPAGESLLDVQQRLLHMLELLAATHSEQTVALVGHLVVNRVLICTMLGLGLESFWCIGQDNGALNLLHYESGLGRVLLLNDTCHLWQAQLQGGSHV